MLVEQRETHRDGQAVDALVRIGRGDRLLKAEVKKWAQHVNLGALVDQVRRIQGKGLLVADYVNPRMADKLRLQGVPFIDTAGNAYINQPSVYVYVAGRQSGLRAEGTVIRGGARRAFEPTGLKVVYAFLCHPDRVNAPYREIAEKAGVALGTVGRVINGLKAAGLLVDKGGKQGRRITHCRKLLDRWVETWPKKLKPKLLMGEFAPADPYWWKTIDVREFRGYWGVETAATGYLDYLKPKVATLYLPEGMRNPLLREARLRKAAVGKGTVLLYRPFWPEAFAGLYTEDARGAVHPILVYADLIVTGDPRAHPSKGASGRRPTPCAPTPTTPATSTSCP